MQLEQRRPEEERMQLEEKSLDEERRQEERKQEERRQLEEERRQLEEERRLEERRQEGRQEDESNLLSEQMKTALELLQPQPDKEKCPPMGCKITSKVGTSHEVACDRCDQWYHVKCVGLTSKKAKSLPRWNCGLC